MKVASWMSSEVFTCRPDHDLGEAARQMWEHDCGALPVVDEEGRVVGMLTDRDALMGSFLRGSPPRELLVRDSMSRTLFTCTAEDRVEDVIRRMGDERIRRVPVIDRAGKAVGMIALGDVVRGLVGMMEAEERHRLSARLIEALACVSEPRHTGPEALEIVPPAVPRQAATVRDGRPVGRSHSSGTRSSGPR